MGMSDACVINGRDGQAVLIRDGDTIERVGKFDIPHGAETIDCEGQDARAGYRRSRRVHGRPPACRAGGIVRVGLMPDQSPVLDDAGHRPARAALIGKPDLWVHPIAAATHAGWRGQDLAEMAINARHAGAQGGRHRARSWIADSGVMRKKVLAYAAIAG
jgi:dihydroorotase